MMENESPRPVVEPSWTRWSAQEIAPAVFVWGAWAIMLGSALVMVGRYGSRVPWWDDWSLIPLATGHTPLTLQALWQPHNEHRIPVPVLIQVGLARVTHCDFRAGMYTSLVLLTLASAGLIGAAQKLRRRLWYADAVLPLIMLGPAHWNTLIWSFQLVFACSTFLTTCILVLALRGGEKPSAFTLMLTALCTLLLPFCGAQGVCLSPALMCLLGYHAVRSLCDARSYARVLLCLGAVVLTTLALTIYPRGLTYAHVSCPSRIAVVVTGLQFLTMALGEAAIGQWPWTGYVVALLLACAVGCLIWTAKEDPASRSRAISLVLYLAAFLCLSLAIGYGRSGVCRGLASRYVTLAGPFLCCLYLAWVLGSARLPSGFVQMAIFALVCGFCLVNFQQGFAAARIVRPGLRDFERDLRAGGSAAALARRHLNVFPNPVLTELYIPMLWDSGASAFRPRDHKQDERHALP